MGTWGWLTGGSARDLLVRAGTVVVVTTAVVVAVTGPGVGLLALIPAAACGLLTVAVGELVGRARPDLADEATGLVARGIVAGPVAVVLVGVWYWLLVVVYGRAVGGAGIALTSGAVGVLAGGVVGWFAARSRRETARAATERAERERMEHQRELLATMDSLLRHHLLNSLNVVRGNARLVDDAVDDEARHHVETILDRTATMEEVITSARRISETMLSGEESLGNRDLTASVETAVERVRESHPEVRIGVETPGSVHVRANDLLVPVVLAVVENAVVHGTPTRRSATADGGHRDADVTVRVDRRRLTEADVDPPEGVRAGAETLTAGDEAAVLTVADEGPGLDEEEKRRAFDPSWHSMESEGEGLGLFLVRTVVDHYGGVVTLTDNDPTGTVARVALPLA